MLCYRQLCTQTATTQDHIGQLFDAYVVVYAINDLASFHAAHDLVSYLRVEFGTDRAILLVANKVDLVRKRKVTEDGIISIVCCVFKTHTHAPALLYVYIYIYIYICISIYAYRASHMFAYRWSLTLYCILIKINIII